jgi:hypothetical protein
MLSRSGHPQLMMAHAKKIHAPAKPDAKTNQNQSAPVRGRRKNENKKGEADGEVGELDVDLGLYEPVDRLLIRSILRSIRRLKTTFTGEVWLGDTVDQVAAADLERQLEMACEMAARVCFERVPS